MNIFIYIAAAISAYLVTGFNPAIALSKVIYGKDIRTMGSGNAGFTNFRRVFGNRWAWWVLVIDLSKAAVVIAVFAYLFEMVGTDRAVGVAYTGLFAILGHAYPVWYKFKGGKGFLVCLSMIWLLDWRAGAVSTGLMLILLFATKYMSLATVFAILTCPVTLVIVKAEPAAICLSAVAVLFVAWRHKENFKRLLNGTENKFQVRKKT